MSRSLLGLLRISFSLLLVLTSGCGSNSNSELENKWERSFQYKAEDNHCQVSAPSVELNLPEFYQKHCSLYGLPIVSSDQVPDLALEVAWSQASLLFENRHDVLQAVIERGVVVAIMSENEVTLDIPEHSALDPFMNTRARGLGASDSEPASSAAEENILCYPHSRYLGENILIHELAHTFHTMGLNKIDNQFDAQLQETFETAREAGKWRNTYSMTNHYEYWAEGVQSYFDINQTVDIIDGVHNFVNTREELILHDPDLYNLISSTLLTEKMIPLCPESAKNL